MPTQPAAAAAAAVVGGSSGGGGGGSCGRAATTAAAAAAATGSSSSSSSDRTATTAAATASAGGGAVNDGGRPVLLFDVLDTVVADPFFEHMPRFFGLTFEELLASKHPTAWLEFERGDIDEPSLLAKFFADARAVDGAALVRHMAEHYRYVDGMEALLARLKGAGYALHAVSNYPEWWRHIETKLRLSRYLSWTFVSCEGPMRGLRKPAPAAYEAVTRELQLPPERLVFVDDRQPNVDAAAAAGMVAIKFGGRKEEGRAAALERELRAIGLEF